MALTREASDEALDEGAQGRAVIDTASRSATDGRRFAGMAATCAKPATSTSTRGKPFSQRSARCAATAESRPLGRLRSCSTGAGSNEPARRSSVGRLATGLLDSQTGRVVGREPVRSTCPRLESCARRPMAATVTSAPMQSPASKERRKGAEQPRGSSAPTGCPVRGKRTRAKATYPAPPAANQPRSL
jgi:hypothetical protein